MRDAERKGLLVEEAAVDLAEGECLAIEQDLEFQAEFAGEISRLFPGCPPERAQAIARHAGARRSGRVGRSAAGRALDPEAITLAVVVLGASPRPPTTRC